MGRSHSGLRGILTEVARTAARLCEAHDANIVQRDGDTLRLVAKYGSVRTTRRLGQPFPLDRDTVHGRAILERRPVHVHDLAAAVRTQFKTLAARQRATGVRTFLAVPLLRDGAPIGTISIRRTVVRPFSSKQIALLKT